MIKKMMLLASMALALVAVAAPAASANWMHEGAVLTEDAQLSLSGPAGFEVPGAAGAHATVHVDITLKGNSTTGTVTKFEDTSCTGTIGYNGLSCTGTPQNLPWHAEVTGAGEITINGMELITHYYSPLDPKHTSPVATSTLAGEIVATADNGEAISSVELSAGNILTANGNPAVVTGNLAASPAGTYGTE